MIKIDGQQIEQKITDFTNLEEALNKIMENDRMQGRIVTDVLVNNENFTEIYPHQAEDMSCDNISSIEVISKPANELAIEISAEMEKVARMMASGAKGVTKLFRDGQESEGLELLQDLLDVTRDFMGMIAHLRDRYLGGTDEEFVARTEKFSNLISEMSEVLENEDWVLLGDLLEYEFIPVCDEWRMVGEKLHTQLKACID